MICALGGTEVCKATHGAHSPMGEVGTNQMVLLQKPVLQTEASAQREGAGQSRDAETLLDCGSGRLPCLNSS